MSDKANVEIVYRYGSGDTSRRERPADAEAAHRRLDDGNRSFAALLAGAADASMPARRVIPIDAADLGLISGAPAQRPYAAIVGCADARVPVELVFGEGPNDLFVVRVAGNVLGADVLASLKYAVDHLGDSLKAIVVLGHSGCGAVSAAVDVFLDPAEYLALAAQPLLRNLLDRLLLVVHASAKLMTATLGDDVERRPGYRAALIEAAAIVNAALAAHTVRQQLGGDRASIRALFAVYVIASREVWAPRGDGESPAGLREPPVDATEFAAFGNAVMRSARIAELLSMSPR
jgi:carbonic anhydrase